MSKINVNFNNKNYNIDEASLSTSINDLKSHLTTKMNGTGAVVILGGTSYNVDSEKLATATNEFVAHLRKIAGNGYKVVVNGIEYGIDPTKVQNAISEIEIVLGNLHNPTIDDGDGIKLLSLDNLALKDINGLFLFAKDGE